MADVSVTISQKAGGDESTLWTGDSQGDIAELSEAALYNHRTDAAEIVPGGRTHPETLGDFQMLDVRRTVEVTTEIAVHRCERRRVAQRCAPT